MEKNEKMPLKRALALLLTGLMTVALALTAAGCDSKAAAPAAIMLPVGWPASLQGEIYEEPPFEDMPGRTNNAFNVADFGDQGSNGWFYRYGKATKPTQSRQIETIISGSYKVSGLDGLEIKSDFVHTAAGVAPILEWRAAEDGAVNVAVTYVKDVNGDANPSFPDGVKIYLYKGEEMLGSHQVEVYTDKQTLLETGVEDLEVKKGDSLYFAVDPNTNNAYDGGLLYIAINDVNTPAPTVRTDKRLNNDANNMDDYGYQGKNGWTYMCGKDVTDCRLVSTETSDGYMNSTSPALVIKGDFIHPAINDKAILCWTPAVNGTVEVRGKYTKFEQNDGNPDWPDGVTVQIYLNERKLFEKEVPAPAEGTETIEFRKVGLSVTPDDRLYFTVSANGNSSYDGGSFDITILDRNGRTTENDIAIDESEIRQNIADVQFDFGPQGSNGWFFQEGYKSEPFGALNVKNYIEGDKYYDNHYLEIKRDYANVGEKGRSAVIKWKVAQDGVIRIDASYTKAPNRDANPSWPDGTRVSIWHNSARLTSQYFAPLGYEVTQDLSVSSLEVKRGDYITMTIDGLDNNAYDGGNFKFAIMSLSGLVGPTEDDVTIPNNDTRTNNADVSKDFGEQGNNGWFYQYGYNTDPFFAINVEKYNKGESYTTKDGIEIKQDYIMPSTKGKCAQVKWQVAQDGKVNVLADYTKLLNQDANPSWPDGVTVTLLYGNKVLKQEYFAPDTVNEVKKDLSVMGLDVKAGEYITLIVDGGENTAYDGGLYHFKIEDAAFTAPAYTPDSDNTADLAADFTGEQGAGGWYYAEGRTPDQANELTEKTDDGAGFKSSVDSVQIKKDFVEPGENKAAMYQWVAGAEGKIDILGRYTKTVQSDSNPSWPDGTHLTVYLNGTELLSEDVAVFGDKENTLRFTLDDGSIEVKKGDILTFAVSSKSNNAYDGGSLAVQIFPHEPLSYSNSTGSNNTVLNGDVTTTQGEKGWYCGYSVDGTGADFAPARPNSSGAYTSALYNGLELKKDGGGQPAAEAGSVYRWVAAKDGDIWLDGSYTKGDFSGNDSDGVHVAVYLNGEPVDGLDYDVTGSGDKQDIKYDKLTVKAGDKLDFVITAKGSNSFDYGTLAMKISDTAPAVEPEYVNTSGKNEANLFDDFGEQGGNGWYYGVCDWSGKDFTVAEMALDNGGWKLNGGMPELKSDWVHPGAKGENSAAYMWVAAKDGDITITGSYTKEANSETDGVSFRVYQAGSQKQYAKVISGGSKEIMNDGAESGPMRLTVKAGEQILFVISPDDHDKFDGGKLKVDIKPVGGSAQTEYTNTSGTNTADLAGNFVDGQQGSNGWYYGYGNNGSDFALAEKWVADEWKFTSDACGVTVKRDGVEPTEKTGAIYRWVAGKTGLIDLNGTYTKNTHNDGNPSWPDGVKIEVYLNGALIEGMTYDVGVSQTEEITQAITKFGIKVSKGDKLDFVITAKSNNAWDYGKLEMKISEAEPKLLTSLKNDFSGTQGANDWNYGFCDWDGNNFKTDGMQNDAAEGWRLNGGNPQLKNDYVHPGDKCAAYVWTVQNDGVITVVGSYTKHANTEDPNANGVTFRVFHNPGDGNVKFFAGPDQGIGGGIAEAHTVTFNQTLTVKAGDRIIFSVNAEGNSSYDGGNIAVSIYEGNLTGIDIPVPTAYAAPVMQAIAPVPAVPAAPVVTEYVNNGEDNSTSLVESFSGKQGDKGWYYGSCRADGAGFVPLGYDAAQAAYIGADGLMLKANGVRTGADGNASAAYLWVAAADGQISLTGSYAVSADQEGGASLRVLHAGEQLLAQYAPAGGQVPIDTTLTVTKGDQLLFVISPDGENAVDGLLQVAVAPIPEAEEEAEDPDAADAAENTEPGEEPEQPAGDEPVEAPGSEEPGKGPDAEQQDKVPGADEQDAGEPKDGELNGDPAKSQDEAKDGEQGSQAEDSPDKTPEPPATPEAGPVPEPTEEPKEPESMPGGSVTEP